MEALTFEELLTIWWAITWRTVIAAVAIGFVLGAIGGIAMGIAGHQEASADVGGLLGYLGSFPASFWAVRNVLKKRFKRFKLELVREAA